MGIEIERRFLVADDRWRGLAPGRRICQGYLSLDPERVVRVRIEEQQACLTIKGRGDGLARPEFEYPIPLADGRELLQLCGLLVVDKLRHRIEVGGRLWEVDEFGGANQGLVLAEIELNAPDESFQTPPWLGPEVTTDFRYCNVNLARDPWGAWP